MDLEFKKCFVGSAGEGIRTPEPTEGQDFPVDESFLISKGHNSRVILESCAFDRSATPASPHYRATLE